jgi:hypothetical protein
MMASSMVLSPISAMATRPVEIRKASNTSSFAGVRRTDHWHPQPAPAWKHPAKPAVLPCWRGLKARDAVARCLRPRKRSAPSSPGERKCVDANPADRCGRLLPDDGRVFSGDRIVRQERGVRSMVTDRLSALHRMGHQPRGHGPMRGRDEKGDKGGDFGRGHRSLTVPIV